jgi:hypothetical protein
MKRQASRLRGRPVRALVGLGAIAVYLAGVAISGHLSVLARRPILDGSGPPPPYNYVEPPPDVAGTNQQPGNAETTVRLGPKGSAAKVLTAPDGQFSFVMRPGLFPPHTGAHEVRVTAEPLAPSKFPPLPSGYDVRGNVYDLTATYEPRGGKIEHLGFNSVAILVYPIFVDLHTTSRAVFLTTDGKTWQALDSTDVPGLYQIQASTKELGSLVVGAKSQPLTSASPSPAGSAGGQSPLTWILVAGAVLILVLAIAANATRGQKGRKR